MSRSIEDIKFMNNLDAEEQAEDVIRDINTMQEQLQKNNCDVDRVLEKLKSCEISMRFILHELK